MPLGTELARRQIERNRAQRISQFLQLAVLNDRAETCLHRAFYRVCTKRLLRLAQELLIDLNRGLHGVVRRSQAIDTHTITCIDMGVN